MKSKTYLFFFTVAAFLVFAHPARSEDKLSQPPPPCHTALLTGVNVKCHGLSNGSATVTINKAGTYKVIWSTGVIINTTTTLSHSISNLSAGYYDVTVIDLVNGCSAFDIINITEPAKLTTSRTIEDVLCYGQSTGKVSLNVNGGTPGYSYQWSNTLQITKNITNLTSGLYEVTVTDQNLCKAYDSAFVNQPLQALGHSVLKADPTCTGFSNGWIDLTVWGGTTPYIYNWGVASSQDLNNITAGNYSVTITDAHNCVLQSSLSLYDPPLLTVILTSTDNLCYGTELGEINLTTTGGTPPYNYAWANSSYLLAWTTEDLSDLSNDQWYVTVTDQNGCILHDSAVIDSPPEITTSIVSTNVTAFGGTNGTIDITVAGGVSPYTFIWSNGDTTQNLTDLPSNWYTVVVTDLNNCTHTDSVFISQPLSPLTVEITATHVLCFGGSNGTASAAGSGGTPPYTLMWSTASTSPEIIGLTAGVYSITITDFYGNTAADTIEVEQPDAIAFNYSITNVSCFGLSNGAIDITVTGGTAPYSFAWRDSEYVLAALTEDITGVEADQYYLVATDTFGCTGNINITVQQPYPLETQIDHTDAICAGSATGTANCVVSGGTGPFDYLWSNGEQTAELTGLYAGMYYLTVTDSHNCLVTDSVDIEQADSIHIDYSVSPVSCIDQHDGKISLSVYGGNGGYSYLWSNGATEPELENLLAGTYLVTVTDIMGCTAMESIVVERIMIDCINIPSCFTPNGDGLNDNWRIKDADLYPEFFLEIYNRWGQLLLGQYGSYEQWDGNSNGRQLPAETYYYFIRIKNSSPVIHGTVTIVR
ncbi:MAG: T9SS type B sorting domain-containing protein [Bacteroidales bacterium]